MGNNKQTPELVTQLQESLLGKWSSKSGYFGKWSSKPGQTQKLRAGYFFEKKVISLCDANMTGTDFSFSDGYINNMPQIWRLGFRTGGSRPGNRSFSLTLVSLVYG